jgi:hypothetical protein
MNKKIISKISVIGLLVLFVAAAFGSSVSSTTVKIENNNYMPLGKTWSDDFESYSVGQFLDGSTGSGGWKGWDNDPQYGAYVVDTVAYDGEKSVEIVDNSDLVHEYSGYTSGQWTYSAYQYIPDGFSGTSYFILLSNYTDGLGQLNLWAVQIAFDSTNQVVESQYDSVTLPLIIGEWVELLTLIDLDADLFKFYYNGQLLMEKPWTNTPNNDGSGILNIGAVDLYANLATEVYYDAMSLESGWPTFPNLACLGDLRWEGTKPGDTVTGEFTVKNDGDPGSMLDWEITEWPEWGTDWSFTPSSGTGLTPEAGEVTVEVSVVAPEDSQKEFTGSVKVINSVNPGDYCRIDAYMMTPRDRAVNHPLLYRVLEKFPNAFPILRQILGF